jgi:hypothetical protein
MPFLSYFSVAANDYGTALKNKNGRASSKLK